MKQEELFDNDMYQKYRNKKEKMTRGELKELIADLLQATSTDVIDHMRNKEGDEYDPGQQARRALRRYVHRRGLEAQDIAQEFMVTPSAVRKWINDKSQPQMLSIHQVFLFLEDSGYMGYPNRFPEVTKEIAKHHRAIHVRAQGRTLDTFLNVLGWDHSESRKLSRLFRGCLKDEESFSESDIQKLHDTFDAHR